MFIAGQRWISETEPELGLGTILAVDFRFVEIIFPVSNIRRKYASRNAPLTRVLFKPGDRIQTKKGENFTVEKVFTKDDLVVYQTKDQQIPESELSDKMSFTSPEDRFFCGQTDPENTYLLRQDTLNYYHQLKGSPLRGLTGSRVSLIPHQFYIAEQVTGRNIPRVLLADEVGLGKTIEACLIINRLLQSERVERVLIITPEPLVNQWFVELFRRFNLVFRIVDQEFCEGIEESNPDLNPFLEAQLVLCSLSFLTEDPFRMEQVLDGDWDLLAVDEAHHLGWSTEKVSREYKVIEALSLLTPSLLLLTATPEQLGMESHFARLKLLDPDRFHDFELFLRETAEYGQIAETVATLLQKGKINQRQQELIEKTVGATPELREQLVKIKAGDQEERKKLLELLVDQHGTSRVFFRNNRSVMPDFPKRKVCPVPLNGKIVDLADLRKFLKNNPAIDWLSETLAENQEEKFLLICHDKKLAIALEEIIKTKIMIKTALFHEDLSLIARDRNAAYFSEVDGARILFCSEIGSEGRNFQFARNLVLFDLPVNPDLLEQRIGRLDRIGQKAEIKIHVPFLQNSAQEVLFRIYQDGLDAFETFSKGSMTIFSRFIAEIREALEKPEEFLAEEGKKLNLLTEAIREYKQDLYFRLEKARDLILEYNSFRPEQGLALVEKISERDQNPDLALFMNRLFDQFGLEYEELAEKTCFVSPSSLSFIDNFPFLPAEGITFTYDRKLALEREDYAFLSWEHPLVNGIMELLLSSEKGNCCLVSAESEEKFIFLEAVYLLECVAPKELHADRFLPGRLLKTVVNHRLEAVEEIDLPVLRDLSPESFFQNPDLSALLKLLLEKSFSLTEQKVEEIIAASVEKMNEMLIYESKRLLALKKINPNIRDEEIEFVREQLLALNQHLNESRIRLDSLRVVVSSNLLKRN